MVRGNAKVVRQIAHNRVMRTEVFLMHTEAETKKSLRVIPAISIRFENSAIELDERRKPYCLIAAGMFRSVRCLSKYGRRAVEVSGAAIHHCQVVAGARQWKRLRVMIAGHLKTSFSGFDCLVVLGTDQINADQVLERQSYARIRVTTCLNRRQRIRQATLCLGNFRSRCLQLSPP